MTNRFTLANGVSVAVVTVAVWGLLLVAAGAPVAGACFAAAGVAAGVVNYVWLRRKGRS